MARVISEQQNQAQVYFYQWRRLSLNPLRGRRKALPFPILIKGGGPPVPFPPKPTFSKTMGPGARAASPAFKPIGRRPSLPRPQSPVRQTPAKLATPKVRPSIGLAKSQIGTGPQYRASPVPKSSKFGGSLRRTSAATTTQKQLSPLGPESSFDEEPELTPTPTPAAAVAVAKSIDGTMQEEEIK